MSTNALTQLFVDYFSQAQPEVVKEEEILEEAVFKSPFLAAQSLLDDIIPSIESDMFYALSLVGPQGKGKTFLASLIATKAEDLGYMIVYAKAEDFFDNLDEWVAKIKIKLEQYGTDKLFLALDDMSYSNDRVSKKKSANFKHFVGDVRHVFEHAGFDPKVFMVYISHKLHSVPPILRNSGSWIFSSMQAGDRDDAMKVITKRKEMQEKLQIMYEFIAKVSTEGPKLHPRPLRFSFGKHEMEFVWGKKDNPGDGRLMVSYHAGDLRIFHSKVIPEMIDISSDIYRIKYVPPPPPTEEEKEEKKVKIAEALKKKAEELFPINKED